MKYNVQRVSRLTEFRHACGNRHKKIKATQNHALISKVWGVPTVICFCLLSLFGVLIIFFPLTQLYGVVFVRIFALNCIIFSKARPVSTTSVLFGAAHVIHDVIIIS